MSCKIWVTKKNNINGGVAKLRGRSSADADGLITFNPARTAGPTPRRASAQVSALTGWHLDIGNEDGWTERRAADRLLPVRPSANIHQSLSDEHHNSSCKRAERWDLHWALVGKWQVCCIIQPPDRYRLSVPLRLASEFTAAQWSWFLLSLKDKRPWSQPKFTSLRIPVGP